MKKIKFSLFITLIFAVLTDCKFQTPEKISVRTNAEYNFSLGSIDKSFELEGFGSLAEDSVDGSVLYDYFPAEKDEKVQQFLMDIPVEEIPVDFSSYFDKSDVALAIRELSFEKNIGIPEINKNVNQTIDSVYVNTAINSLLSVTGNPDVRHLALFGSPSFTSITYTTGSFDIVCPSLPNGTTVTMLSNGDQLVATFTDGKASFPIDGYTMKNDAQIWFSIDSSLSYTGVIRVGSEVLCAEGVNTSVPVPINQTIPMGDSTSTLDEATIGIGEFRSVVGIPSSWTNVSCNYGVTISGAMNVSSPASGELTKSIDLAGKNIGSGDISFESEVNLSFVNSYVSFETPFEVAISCTVNKFDVISINVTGIQTGLQRRDRFSESMLSAIKRLMLIQSGIKGTYKNTLPVGNNILVTADSDFFDMNHVQQNLLAGKTNEPISILSPEDMHKLIYVKDETNSALNEYNGWDFDMKIELPGSTPSHPDRITLYSVESGVQYEIKIEFKPELNWEYVVLRGNTAPISRELPLGLSFKKLLDNMATSFGVDFSENFTLKELPLYLMVIKPDIRESASTQDVFADSKYKGEISLFYGKQTGSVVTKLTNESGNAVEKKILGSELPNKGVMTFVPDPDRIIKDNAIITDYAACSHSIEADLVDLLNTPVSDDYELFINYELNFTNDDKAEEIIITKEMYDNSDDYHTSITVCGLIVIPLAFKVPDNHDVDINFNEVFGFSSEGDLFNRDGPTDDGVFSDNADVIDSFSIIYTGNKIPIYSSPDILLNINLFNDGNPTSFKLREGKITVASKDIDKLFNVYPFSPRIDIHFIRGSEFSIARKMAFDLKIQLQLVTDGVITF